MPLKLCYTENVIEAGVDESGRGPLFGSVVAAAVILNPDVPIHHHLNDSKKVTKKRREVVKEWVEDNAVAFGVAFVSPERIDEINILNATHEAMRKALDDMELDPDHIIVDGNSFPGYTIDGRTIPHTTIVDGDALYASIAAASVLAKEYRDEDMDKFCDENPEIADRYGLRSNKGYGTKAHLDGIKQYGITQFHRRSFRVCKGPLLSNEQVFSGVTVD